MDALQAYGSEDESSSDESARDTQPKTNETLLRRDEDVSNSLDPGDVAEKQEAAVATTSKRQRPWDDTNDKSGAQEGVKSLSLLPPPPTAKDHQDDEVLIYWPTDYLTAKQQQLSSSMSTRHVSATGASNIAPGASSSSPMENHNPHLFKATVEEYGLDEMGSNICMPQEVTFQDWEYNLQREQQARIHQQQ